MTAMEKLNPCKKECNWPKFCLYLRRIKGCYSLYSRNRRYHSGNWNNRINSITTSL